METANAARSAYDLAYQVSPIILEGGTYSSPMPIIGLIGQLPGIGNFPGQLVSLGQGLATSGLSADDFFARFLPLPGSTLISNSVGKYPFANQQVAANAVIQQPLNISLKMICPVKEKGGYLTKLAIITSLQNALQAHCTAGGTFNIATPAYIYTNCIMTGMTDITSGTTNQKQVEYQLDFEQPLITQAAATAALSTLMGRLTDGQQVTSTNWWGQFSNVPTTTGMSANVPSWNTPFTGPSSG